MNYCIDEETVIHNKLPPDENWINYRSDGEGKKNRCAATCDARRRERSATVGEIVFSNQRSCGAKAR